MKLNILDHKPGLRFNPNMAPTTEFVGELNRSDKNLYKETEKNVLQSYIKYKKKDFDKKNQTLYLELKLFILHCNRKQTIKGQKYLFTILNG